MNADEIQKLAEVIAEKLAASTQFGDAGKDFRSEAIMATYRLNDVLLPGC
jgi:hypothetical protein